MANEQVKVQSRYDSFSLVTGSARKLHTFSPTMDLMRQVKHNLEQTAFHNWTTSLELINSASDDTGTAQGYLHDVLVSSHVPSQITRKKQRGWILGVHGGDILVYTFRMDFFFGFLLASRWMEFSLKHNRNQHEWSALGRPSFWQGRRTFSTTAIHIIL